MNTNILHNAWIDGRGEKDTHSSLFSGSQPNEEITYFREKRVRVLDRIVANRGYPLKMRMDNGSELISLTLAQCAEEHEVMLDIIEPGKPTQNAFIERFNRTYRIEILDFYLFRTLNEAREITERWLTGYNSERPHESLNNLTPEEYRLMTESPEVSKSAWN